MVGLHVNGWRGCVMSAAWSLRSKSVVMTYRGSVGTIANNPGPCPRVRAAIDRNLGFHDPQIAGADYICKVS